MQVLLMAFNIQEHNSSGRHNDMSHLSQVLKIQEQIERIYCL